METQQNLKSKSMYQSHKKRRRSVGGNKSGFQQIKGSYYMPKKLKSQSTNLYSQKKRLPSGSYYNVNPSFKSAFTMQQANCHSVSFKKEGRFPKGRISFKSRYVSRDNLPTTFARQSAQITTSKKIFMNPYVFRNARENPSPAHYRTRRNISDYFHGQSFTTERKFNTKKFIPGLKIKDRSVVKAEPSVHHYNISRDINIGKFRATFESRYPDKAKDGRYFPSPQEYKVNSRSFMDTRNADGMQFQTSKRVKFNKTLGQGPAAYNLPGQFSTMGKKTFNIRFQAQVQKNQLSWKARKYSRTFHNQKSRSYRKISRRQLKHRQSNQIEQ